MRESNFRSAIANRASVSITTTLYDRRALDCSSDRALINSLNHLAYLTSSSARVRETLCFDGGLERLINILKECQMPLAEAEAEGLNTETDPAASLDLQREPALVAWKWSMALQCLLFLGTRGSENIRRRVVEAGIIPVISTVLDNYIELRNESGRDLRDLRSCCTSKCRRAGVSHGTAGSGSGSGSGSARRPDAVDADIHLSVQSADASGVADPGLMSRDGFSFASANEDTLAPVSRSDSLTDDQQQPVNMVGGESAWDVLVSQAETVDSDASLSTIATQNLAQPGSGSAVSGSNAASSERELTVAQAERILQEMVMTPNIVSGSSTRSMTPDAAAHARIFRGRVLIPRDEDIIWSLEILAFVSKYAYLKPSFQNSHLIPKLSVRNPNLPPLVRSDILSRRELEGRFNVVGHEDEAGDMDMSDDDHHHNHRLDLGHDAACDLHSLSSIAATSNRKKPLDYDSYDFEGDEDIDPEYESESLNVFPLVEQLTACKEPRDIHYWAGIIMRNSCRKDESRGGIRQCANFQCGKWEEYPRHFAKCRQCKRTKYCSKDCQLAAWPFHRYWCAPGNSSNPSTQLNACAAPAERPQSMGQPVAARHLDLNATAVGANVGFAAAAAPMAQTAEQLAPETTLVPVGRDTATLTTTL